MNRTLSFIFLGFLCLSLFMPHEVAGKTQTERDIAETFGYITGAMLILSVSPWIVRRLLAGKDIPWARDLNRSVLRKFHPVFGTGALGFVILHDLLYDRCNDFIQAGIYLMEALAVTGILLYVKMPREPRKLLLKFHISGTLGLLSLVLVVVGHLVL